MCNLKVYPLPEHIVCCENKLCNSKVNSGNLESRICSQSHWCFFNLTNCIHFCYLQSIREVSARISHIEQVLKEKSTDMEKAEDLDEKDALRHEIHSLRKTKECLSEERRGLDEKLQKVILRCNETSISK